MAREFVLQTFNYKSVYNGSRKKKEKSDILYCLLD